MWPLWMYRPSLHKGTQDPLHACSTLDQLVQVFMSPFDVLYICGVIICIPGG